MNAIRSIFRLNRPRSTRRRRNIRQHGTCPAIQRLEDRSLLAGNVLAVVNGSGDLVLTGDAQSNTVEVVVVDGNLVVRGSDNTTINGATTPFVAVTGSSTVADDFFARLGRGHDVLLVEGVTINGHASVAGHTGSDSVGFEDTSVGGDLRVNGFHGADNINLEGVQVGRDLVLWTGRNNDTIHAANTTIADDVWIVTGRHSDVVVFDTVTVGDDAFFSTGAGGDDLVMMNSTIGDRFRATTGRGSDFVMFDASTVSGRSVIRTNGHHDQVLMENASRFSRLNVHTGSGGDTVALDASTVVSGRRRIRGRESAVVNTAARDRELNAAVTGALPRSAAAAAIFAGLGTTGPLSLAVDVSMNTTVQSGNTLVTNDANFQLEVATQAGATVAVDSDNDGQFDDGTTIADASGNASLSVTLVNDATNAGANIINVQTSNNVDTPLTEQTSVYLAEGTVVRFNSTLGTWDVELFDEDAPNTVGAFLDDLSRYNNTVVHRNIPNFIVQGGGFSVNGTTVSEAPNLAAPPNEFAAASPPNSNVRGTISTAQLGSDPLRGQPPENINTFSGEWFFNTVNNDGTPLTPNSPPSTNLDAVPHTVFGRVIGDGMTVIDQINAIEGENVTNLLTNASVLTDAPLLNYTPGNVPTVDNFITINSVTTILPAPGSENTFLLPENSVAGTSVGSVTAAVTGDPLIYEFNDPNLVDELRLNADDHLEGNDAATVVLVEYISLQCPACANAHPVIQQLLADNPDDVVLVRRHLPNDTGTGGGFAHSFEAALAAEAAGRQNMFDEMVDQLFARQSEWDNTVSPQAAQAVFEDIAVTTLGLNLTQFNADIADPVLTDRINRDIADAGILNATATPTFFLNGQLTNGTPDSAAVQAATQALDRTFALDRRTAALTVVEAADLDFETNPTFTLDISATNGTSASVPVTVNLIDAFTG